MTTLRTIACMLSVFGVMTRAAAPASGSGNDSTVVVVPGEHYKASGARQFFWGEHYRQAWTASTEVDVLDLETFAGGLEIYKKGSGRQTIALEFLGADGKRYAFRSIDKDPIVVLPESWHKSIAADILQDQISSQHPFGFLIADYLEDTLGVLHAKPKVYVMPDDPALGEYREEFAGILGMMVERPGKHVRPEGMFAGATEVLDGQEIYDVIERSPENQIDAPAFLRARLLDVFFGDWDRHRYQWRWARYDGDWQPIPEDRDQAFSKLDGLLPSRAYHFIPELVGFKKKYPDIVGLHMTGQELDRRWLAGLERSVWDSVATDMQAKLSDVVIESAVQRLPKEMYEADGKTIETALKQRRDNLPQIAAKFYELLARRVEVQTTNVAEEATVTLEKDGTIEITIRERDANKQAFYRRRFDPKETDEIRLRMHGGNDRVVVNGSGDLGVNLRVIGGPGDDEVEYINPIKGIKVYDQHGSNRVIGNHGGNDEINAKPYEEWEYGEGTERPPREWGSWDVPKIILGLSSDIGLGLGVGETKYLYRFRKHPYATKFVYGAAVSTKGKWLVTFDAELRNENSPSYWTLNSIITKFDILHFYGLGNDTPKSGEKSFFSVNRTLLRIEPTYSRAFSSAFDVSIGAVFKYSRTGENEDKFISSVPDLYGSDNFAEVGALVRLKLDTRDYSAAATRGFFLDIGASYYPEFLDVKQTFATLQGAASTYLNAGGYFQPTLALRAGGRKVWGDFPWFESSFIGGNPSLRGFDAERFAGDTSVYGAAELRLRLATSRLLLPGDYGVFGFADVGRVYLDGESPGGWHQGFGGGLWLSFFGRQNTLSAAIGSSDEDTLIYITYGFAF